MAVSRSRSIWSRTSSELRKKRGWDTCPSKSIPAAEIERFVVAEVRSALGDSEALSDWDSLGPTERAALLRELVSQVSYDGAERRVAVTLHETPQDETIEHEEEHAA